MSVEAYEDLARNVLVWLVESGALRTVERDRTIAYETYYLPARIRLLLPDQEEYTDLLNPKTREEHAAFLASALMRVVVQEERDSWVVLRSEVAFDVEFASSAEEQAEPVYNVSEREEDRKDDAEKEYIEPILRIKIGQEVFVLRRGQGLLPLSQSSRAPRVSVLEADGSGHEVAFLVVSGPTKVETADGREQTYEAHTKIPVTHDLVFEVSAPRWKLWWGSVRGELEILGVSRSHRPGLMFFPEGERGGVEWDRNRTPVFSVGDRSDDRVHIAGLGASYALSSGGGDAISIESLHKRSGWLTWFDGAPLWLPALDAIPVLGAHLQALGHDTDAVRVRVLGNRPSKEPVCVRVRGWLPPQRTKDPFAGLFGFEQPIATVFEEGTYLDVEHAGGDIQVPVANPDLVRVLFEIAVDGCMGCKIKPRLVELHAEDQDLHMGAWSWVEGMLVLTMPGLRLRLEAFGRVQVVYDDPQPVKEISADPEDVWSLDGWRFQVTEEELVVHGQGRTKIHVDQTAVTQPMRLEGRREHRIQAGHKVYRVVRRHFEASGSGR